MILLDVFNYLTLNKVIKAVQILVENTTNE